MRYANRLVRLGTETAFRVSAEAAKLAATGRKVYPFHLGDINLPTPRTVVKGAEQALAQGKTGYCPSEGVLPLREALADNLSSDRGVKFSPEQVSVQPGGKPTVGKFIQVAMNPGDEVLYPNPGYPIYESQILYHGGVAKPYRYVESGDNFVIDLDYLRAQIGPRTRALIYNNYQNPLGAISPGEEMEALAELACRHDLWVLSDEAYFEMLYQGKGESIVSLPAMAERTVLLYTFSKKFAMTGWRLGACVGPTEFVTRVNKLNVNDESCTTHFIQYAGLAGLQGAQDEPQAIRETLRRRRDVCVDALRQMPGVRCPRPEATFYLFVEVSEAMRSLGLDSVDDFRTRLLAETGVSFCGREHFGRPQPGETGHYIRLAYSGINQDDIAEGLSLMREYLVKKGEG